MHEPPASLKQRIRAEMRAQREEWPPEWIATAGQAIAERVMALEAYRAADQVGLYAALPREVPMDALRSDCRRRSRRILLPAWHAQQACYGFKAWAPETALHDGPHGIPEPDADAFAELAGTVCVLTPGLAFDSGGWRIGYGGGYYDRLLSLPVQDGRRVAVGVCYDFQFREEPLPRAPWDRPVDVVVTERRTVFCPSRMQSTITPAPRDPDGGSRRKGDKQERGG